MLAEHIYVEMAWERDLHTYIHTYIYTYIHTCILHTYLHTYLHKYIYAYYMHTHVHKYIYLYCILTYEIHTYMHAAYIHTYIILTYMRTYIFSGLLCYTDIYIYTYIYIYIYISACVGSAAIFMCTFYSAIDFIIISPYVSLQNRLQCLLCAR